MNKDVDIKAKFIQLKDGTLFYLNNYLFVKLHPTIVTIGKEIPTEAREERVNAFCLRNFCFTTVSEDVEVEYCGREARDDLVKVWGYSEIKNYLKM